MKTKRNIPLLLDQLGIRIMFAITINFYIILFTAMFNQHAVDVLFNHFNEALIEYVLFISVIPIIVYSMIYEIKETRKRKQRRKKE